MRISDWSSDVCSSDLIGDLLGQEIGVGDHQQLAVRRADMRALEADALDRPRRIVVFDRLSDAERPVEDDRERSEEHTSELQSLMRISYAVFCLKKKKPTTSVYNIQSKKYINHHHF